MTTPTPARNLLRQHYDSYRASFSNTNLDLHQEKASLVPKLSAAADEEAGSSSTSSNYDQGWLELGVASHASGDSETPTDWMSSAARRSTEEKVELNLFLPDRLQPSPLPMPAATMVANAPVIVPPLPALEKGFGYSREQLWSSSHCHNPVSAYCREASSYISPNQNTIESTSTQLPMMAGYNLWQFGSPPGTIAVSGKDIRVVSTPIRPQIGVWFELRAARNQVMEPFLPQILKSYLRIKDGRMTVRLLMKYLANKLGLNDESEVEITCRGLQLLPFLTLQHVRDHIWGSGEAIPFLPDSLSTEHGVSHSLLCSSDTRCVMVLQYSRRARCT